MCVCVIEREREREIKISKKKFLDSALLSKEDEQSFKQNPKP